MRKGVLYGIGAYGLWGLFPLYFPLLDPAGAVEVLAHRITWTLVAVGATLLVLRRLDALRAALADRRRARLLAGAAVLIACNWVTYIVAVTSDRTLEAALGYFVTPLVSVALGVLVLGERLHRTQWFALALGAAAVVVLTAYYGGFPWIALVLAASFGTYGLLKKLAGVGAVESLAAETLVLLGPALAFLAVLAASGEGSATTEGPDHLLLLLSTGPVTAVPLLLFAGCVARVELVTVGLLQYLAPVLQFLVGWLLQGEAMPASRWAGFTLVWLAIVLLSLDALRRRTAGGPAPRALEPQVEG